MALGSQKHKANNSWQIQEAKAKFSQLVEDATEKGNQIITKNGVAVAVILSIKEFEIITQPKNTLLEFFLNAPCPDVELDTLRSKDLPREVDL